MLGRATEPKVSGSNPDGRARAQRLDGPLESPQALQALHDDLADVLRQRDTSDGGDLAYSAEYPVVVGRRG